MTTFGERGKAHLAATKSEIAAQKPKDWLIVNDTEYIPVVDDLTTKMLAARMAFVSKNWKTSADEIREVADLLDKEASGASRQGKEQVSAEAKNLRSLAQSLDAGKSPALKTFDSAIAKAHRADLDRDWLAVDTSTWYPYVDEPNAHSRRLTTHS